MEELTNLWLSDMDFKNIIGMNPSIQEMDDKDVNNHILFLRDIGCEERHIRNIIITNPFYFNRDVDDLIHLVYFLTKIGITSLNLLFDSNPFLLNKNDFEIEEFVNVQLNNGMNIEDIGDLIDSNPYIIDEI